MFPSDSHSFGASLGAAFELQPRRPRSSTSTSSNSSASFDLSSTDDELSINSPSPSRDTSWSSSDNRDPFSASAKPVDGLKLYELRDNVASSRRTSASPPSVRSTIGRVPPYADATPKAGSSKDKDTPMAGLRTTSQRRSPAVLGRFLDDTFVVTPSEDKFWDNVLSEAIDNANGSLDLSYAFLS